MFCQSTGSTCPSTKQIENIEQFKQNFNDNILSLVQQYPDVEFYFYYPPYSIMRQAVWYDLNPERYESQLVMRNWMYAQLSQFSNTKMYDFQTESEWTFNLDLYKDLSHHSQDVNSWITQAIGSDDAKYRMTNNNIAELNEQLVEDTVTATLDEQGNVTRVIVHINGRKHTFTQKIIDGKQQFLVYVKETAAVFGGEAIWDEGTKATILKAKGKKDISITAGSTQAVVGDQLIDMNSTPLSMNGKTMIPFAFVAEQWGWQVKQETGKNAVRLNVQER